MTFTEHSTAPVAGSKKVSTRAAAGSFVGGAIEYYDFFIYGTAAAVILNRLFFPEYDPTVGTIAAFATFGVAYLFRPVGAAIFGHIGDRHGRKITLLITLWVMGGATLAIGFLPTYDQIGIWAPVLLVLMRLLQGLAAGGELGGASALAVEHAPPGRRGFYGAFATAGTSAGIALGSGVFALVLTLPDEQFESWGWRIPFLASAVVVLVGYLIRRTIPEPPAFVEASHESETEKLPIISAFRDHPLSILIAFLVFSAQIVAFYLVTVYSVSYAGTLDGPVQEYILSAVSIVTLVNVFALIMWGAVSDRLGRTKVVTFGLLAQAVLIFVFFLAVDIGSFTLILLAMLGVLCLGQAAIVGVSPSHFSELFEPKVRVTGIGMGMQLASIVGGFTPLIATSLAVGGGTVVTLAIGSAVICVLAMLSLRIPRHIPADLH